MPNPFGGEGLSGLWITLLILAGYAIFFAIAMPWSLRRWRRRDESEHERVGMVFRDLAARLGGEFIEPREVMGVDDDGDEYGPVLDHGTVSVRRSGLAVDVGVQPLAGPAGKCVKLRIALPEGRSWAVVTERERDLLRAPHLKPDARAELKAHLWHCRRVHVEPAALTAWMSCSRGLWWRAQPDIDGVTTAYALVPHIDRAVAIARLLLVPQQSVC